MNDQYINIYKHPPPANQGNMYNTRYNRFINKNHTSISQELIDNRGLARNNSCTITDKPLPIK